MTHAAAAPRPVLAFDVDVGDGLRLHGERAGTGPPVLLLHGFTGRLETWTALTVRLAPANQVIAVDLPGHGGSSAPADPARYALTRVAGDLARLLDALAIEHAAVLGYSMGGRAALRFALAYPDRVRALVLESTSPGIESEGERTVRVRADRSLADDIERQGVPAFVERWERLPLWASQASLPELARAELRAQRLTNQARGLANSLRGASAGADEPVHERLSGLDVPTLLVAGALDVKYAGLARLMAERLPRARVAIVESAGHAVHLERPEVFGALVQEFLEDVR